MLANYENWRLADQIERHKRFRSAEWSEELQSAMLELITNHPEVIVEASAKIGAKVTWPNQSTASDC